VKGLVRYSLLLLTTFIGACVDPIAFETTEPVRRLVIFGELTQDVEDRGLTIGYTSRFGNPTIPVSDATARLF